MPTAFWEAIFMLVVLKIPMVYLCLVVWWAVRAEPRPLEGALSPARLPEPPPSWHRRTNDPRPHPRAGPARRYSRRPGPVRTARARATR